ncbi:MAG: hypothetical protein LBK08_09315 [Treponema sp.]|nr:hypothetical protein [Treponema sp.]
MAIIHQDGNAVYRKHGIGATVILRDGGWLPGLYEVTKGPYMQEVQKTFTPDYFMTNYISRAFMGLMPVEHKKSGK